MFVALYKEWNMGYTKYQFQWNQLSISKEMATEEYFLVGIWGGGFKNKENIAYDLKTKLLQTCLCKQDSI